MNLETLLKGEQVCAAWEPAGRIGCPSFPDVPTRPFSAFLMLLSLLIVAASVHIASRGPALGLARRKRATEGPGAFRIIFGAMPHPRLTAAPIIAPRDRFL